jgi:glutamyl-tRNA synthetase
MALLSLMARLGSSHPVELRARSLDDLAEGFDWRSSAPRPPSSTRRPLAADRAHVQATPFAEVRPTMRALGRARRHGRALLGGVRENIAALDELARLVALCRDGAEPGSIAEEDADLRAEALALLPEPPYGPETWADWTGAVKERPAARARPLHAAAPRRHRPRARARDGRGHAAPADKRVSSGSIATRVSMVLSSCRTTSTPLRCATLRRIGL